MRKTLLLILLLAPFVILPAQITKAGREVPELKTIFERYGMTGTIIILDKNKDEFFGYNTLKWETGYLPASTFKIANSLIGLETGAIDTNQIFEWNGEKRSLSQWEKELTLTEAFRVSCVPCYQEVARKIGAENMNKWLGKLGYGHMVVTPETIDRFWLEGGSQVTPREQVDFIRRLYDEKLPLAASTMKYVKRMMLQEITAGFRLSGKTGWAIRNGNNYGWFVGYIETAGNVYFVATLVEPINQEEMPDFASARKQITMDALRFLKLIPGNLREQEAGHLSPGDKRLQSAVKRWYEKGGTRPLFRGKDEVIYDSLAYKCIFTLLNNRQGPAGALKHEGVFPSFSGFKGFWAWDSWKHAYILAVIDPELARNSIRAMFDYQDSCGMVADCIFIDSTENNYRDTKPPLSGWSVAEVFRQTGDTAFLKEIFPKLLKYHEWWYTHRDHDHNGLCEYGSTDGTIQAARWESGWDNAVRFDGAVMLQNNNHAWSMNQESADLNAYLFAEKECIAILAQALGEYELSEEYDHEAVILGKKIREFMWDERTGFFYDIGIASKKHIRVPEPNGWIPLWAGIATKEQASLIRKHILDPDEFNTYVPFPTVSVGNPEFDPEKGYWRGPVWLDQAWFAIDGLRKYGFNDDADELTLKLLHNCEGLLDSGKPIRENYHPISGKGLNAEHFSWSAAHILMMLKE
jgi:beta-lactamase class D